jgi:hypothetical protein
VAKILQGISKSSTCEQLHGEAMHIKNIKQHENCKASG